jgi:CUG-BP- and ETR3-like factor
MGTNEEAVAAIETLDQQYVWEGMDAPMVVKWMDGALQKRRREEHLAAMREGAVPSMAGPFPPDGWGLSSVTAKTPQQQQQHPSVLVGLGGLAGAGAAGLRAFPGAVASGSGSGQQLGGDGYRPAPQQTVSGGVMLESGAQLVLPAEVPPPGCAPDAYKLFIGNVPKAYSEEVRNAGAWMV